MRLGSLVCGLLINIIYLMDFLYLQRGLESRPCREILYIKAMLHGAIFLATCNAILLLRDVKLPNTSLRYTPLMFSQHIENSSLISLINIVVVINCNYIFLPHNTTF